MNLQRINDERLVIKNVKNIQLTYVIQTFGVIGILGYDLISNGLNSIKANPLWLVFVASTIIIAFMSFGSSDERLERKNLQKTRLAFVIQLVGIVGILGYDLVTIGREGMKANPLWLLVTLSILLLIFLSMNISVDYEDNKKSAGKGLMISISVLTLISIGVGVLMVYLNSLSTIFDGVISGGILFICGLISFLYLYGLRKSKQ